MEDDTCKKRKPQKKRKQKTNGRKIKKGKNGKMDYRLGYYHRKTRVILKSPHTGKPYKKPRRYCIYIQLSEVVKAANLLEAFNKGLEKAHNNKWILEEVAQL